MNSIIAILLIAVGSVAASSFYVPITRVKGLSWENMWFLQGVMAWIVAPLIFTYLTVPDFHKIIEMVPYSAKFSAIMFGALWGVGSLTFGLSMRYLGVGLGQSISLGLCAAFGTLIPPIVSGQNLFASTEGVLMLIGVTVSLVGISLIGYAASLKSKGKSIEDRRKAVKEFALKKGLIIAIVAGVMSACMNFGINGIEGVIDAGNLFADIAISSGIPAQYASTPALLFVLIGGAFTNFCYCIFLSIKKRSYREFKSISGRTLTINSLLCSLAGLLWFMQFFLYGMGQSYLPDDLAPFGWSILMALNIAFSNIWGVILKEWYGVNREVLITLIIGIVILIASTFIVAF